MPWAGRVLPSPPVERLTLPPIPAPPAPPGFPWIATLAPVAVSIVLWVVTGSLLSLLFVLLGPVVAVAGLIDGRVGRRRALRTAAAEHAAALARLRARVAAAQDAERGRLSAVLASAAWGAGWPRVLPVRTGTGTAPPAVELDRPVDDVDDSALQELREAAAGTPDAPLLVDASAGIGIVGPAGIAASVARSIAVQLAGALSPAVAELAAPPDESWAAVLPHASRTGRPGEYRWSGGDAAVLVAWARSTAALPPGCGERIELAAGARPVALSRASAGSVAAGLAARADAAGLKPPSAGLPERVRLGDLLEATGSTAPGVLAAPVGRDAAGPVVLDLAVVGPHALVAGTTGSGKSELLISWVLAMAHGRTPDELALLLVDFKGGAAFAPLARLPHVVGTLSDLAPRLARRAIESLRAEVLRRERVLADAGLRAIDDLPAGRLARLVIVVDEFAALVAAGPDLHEAFADLAARGRSLGMHLVLCTQRPAGVVRDAVLANIGLRISLRVADRGDSIAMLGDDAAARLPADPRGRAIVLADGAARTMQAAIAGPDDLGRVLASASGSRRTAPWCEPLPVDLALDDIAPDDRGPVAGPGLVFGRADLPAEQRQPPAVHDPERHGALLVCGAAGSGVTTTLATLAASARRAGRAVVVLPPEPADAWAVLEALVGRDAAARPVLLVADDLDLLLARFAEEHRHEAVELLGLLLRGARGSAVVAGVRRPVGPVAALAGQFGSRIVLRQASREDHVLAGGELAAYVPDLPAGSGTWRGVVIQVARGAGGERTLPAPEPVVLPSVTPGEGGVLAIVAGRTAPVERRLDEAGTRVVVLGRDPAPDPEAAGAAAGGATAGDGGLVILGDADAWQADWALLTAARRAWPMAFVGCRAADLRVLLGGRTAPPPLGSDPRECWLARDGTVVRARLDVA